MSCTARDSGLSRCDMSAACELSRCELSRCDLSCYQLPGLARDTRSYSFAYIAVLIIILK